MQVPSPETLLIKRIDWEYFLTFTHAPVNGHWSHIYHPTEKGRKYVESHRVSKWWNQLPFDEQMQRLWRWNRRARENMNIKPRELICAFRWEVGRGGREHFHALVKILGGVKNQRSAQNILRWTWADDLGFGHAHARRSTVHGDDYISKIVQDYEESRFDSHDLRQRHVFFNDAAKRYLRQHSETHLCA